MSPFHHAVHLNPLSRGNRLTRACLSQLRSAHAPCAGGTTHKSGMCAYFVHSAIGPKIEAANNISPKGLQHAVSQFVHVKGNGLIFRPFLPFLFILLLLPPCPFVRGRKTGWGDVVFPP